ncbi:MAG: hypothetical protein EPN34_07025 [Burkholderiaceae bacterium]|nr:MAG: hypothetical protein EPN34_07025 [Burkholderiaceae bacterium]
MKDTDAVAAAAIEWNHTRLRRIAAAKRVPDGLFHPDYNRATAARAWALKEEARALAKLRKACAAADPAPFTIEAELVPQRAIGWEVHP